jgi:hypothetical protein
MPSIRFPTLLCLLVHIDRLQLLQESSLKTEQLARKIWIS